MTEARDHTADRKSGRAPRSDALVALIVAASFLATGCKAPKPTASEPGGAGETKGKLITVACPGETAASVMSRYSASWAAQNGARVEVVSTSEPANTKADVWVIEPAELPHWAAAGAVAEVPATYQTADAAYAWRNLLAPYRERLLTWDGRVYGMPVLGGALLCFYREDLLRDAAARAEFKRHTRQELAPPATWEQFTHIAEFFRSRTGKPSLPPLPRDDKALDAEYYAVAAPFARQALGKEASRPEAVELFSFHYDLSTGRPRLGTPGFVEALRLLQRLQACRPPGSGEPGETFRHGQAVLCIADAAWAGRFQEPGSAVRGRYGVCLVPGTSRYFAFNSGQERRVQEPNRVSYLGSGGWAAVVPRESPHAEIAFAMLAALSGPQTSREVMLEPAWGADIYRREQFDDLPAWKSLELGAGQTNVLVESLRLTLEPLTVNPVYRLRIPEQRTHLEALVEEIRGALTRSGKDPAQVMAEVTKRWEQLDARRPVKDRIREYRISLGLPAE